MRNVEILNLYGKIFCQVLSWVLSVEADDPVVDHGINVVTYRKEERKNISAIIFYSSCFASKQMFTERSSSGEPGAASHVITRINSNVCLLEINSKPARNCQEKHGNFSSVLENLKLEFTSTLKKLFNFACIVFFCRFEALFAVNLLFKMCVIFNNRTQMYSFRDQPTDHYTSHTFTASWNI